MIYASLQSWDISCFSAFYSALSSFFVLEISGISWTLLFVRHFGSLSRFGSFVQPWHIYPSVQCDWLQGIPLETYMLFHVAPFLIGYHLTLHQRQSNVLITFSSGIFLLSSSFCYIYLWKHQCFSHSWTVLYIFLISVWKPALWSQPTCSYYSLFDFVKMSLRLAPE